MRRTEGSSMKTQDMMGLERRMKILELLQEEGSARVVYLSELFDVSEPTIRQDLEKLERQGYIIREHGGAYLRSVSQQVKSLSLQHMENLDKKIKIGKKAAEQIADGDKVILDSGSTTTEIAKQLYDKKELTIITNSLNIALIVGAEYPFDLMVTGGEFKAPTLSLTGEKAAAFFKGVYIDKVFLATGGISPSFELTYPGLADLPVKRAMLEAASKKYLVADSTKLGKTAFASLGSISCVQALITDSAISPETVQRLRDMGLEVIIA
jgi:DeoR/GlpR family transcriptional regulator of sugar metabolism